MKYYSQFKQDYFVDKLVKKEKPGVFVDVGADDGVDLSNTKFFEDKGWAGICIEPRKEPFQKLQKNRKCIKYNFCISENTGEQKFIEIEGEGRMSSGLADTFNARHYREIFRENTDKIPQKETMVRCERLDDILESNGVDHVDYCSIDTEGNEKEVIRSIDFSKVTIDYFTIENVDKDKELRQMMKDRGYVLLRRIFCDDLYGRKELTRNIPTFFFILEGRLWNFYVEKKRRTYDRLKTKIYNFLFK